MKIVVAILFALIAFPASARIAPDPMPPADAHEVLPYFDLDDMFPEVINVPEVVIVGQVPTATTTKVPHVEKVWYCGPVYENALGGHNQDCTWQIGSARADSELGLGKEVQ